MYLFKEKQSEALTPASRYLDFLLNIDYKFYSLHLACKGRNAFIHFQKA